MRCAVDVAPVRAEPRDDAEQVTQALRDEPLREEERRDGWVRVLTTYDYPGWIRAEAVVEGAGSLPEVRAGAPVDEARALLGVRYEWGGLSERGIDCSGLVHLAHRRLGRLVPRDAHQQEAAGTPVDEPAQGDLVLYGPDGGEADHVAFWLGGGRILHSTGRDGGIGVVEESEPPELRARRRGFVRL